MSQVPDFVFSFPFSGSVWSTALEVKEEKLLLEIRDREEMGLSFYMIHLQSYELSDPFFIPEADWWTTLITMVSDLVFLERYTDPQDPIKKQLIIFQIQEKKTLYVLDDQQLAEFLPGGIKTRRLSNPEEENVIDLSLHFPHENSVVLYPTHYSESSDAFETVKEFLQDKEPVLGCEYLEWKDYIIISYYLRLSNKFVRYLLIIKNEQEILHRVQDQDLAGFASGSFFLIKNLMVFIENGNTIRGVKI